MTHSAEINEIAKALSSAQGLIKGAKKDADNPFFKSKYADLASVFEACRVQLSNAGIAVVQTPSTTDDGKVSVTTMLVHASGQWFSDTLTVKPKDDGAQAMGSCISYLRRYSLAAFAGVAPEDDDAEAAMGRKDSQAAAKHNPQLVRPGGFDKWLLELLGTSNEGTPALEAAWKKSSPEYRTYLTTTDNEKWEAMKAKAAKVKAVAA